MKKVLLFLLALMLGFSTLQVSAQETLTVHDGTTTNGYVPVYGFYADAYLKAEFVIPANDLGDMAGGSISGMKFYSSTSSVSWGAANFQVFMTEVNNETISAFEGTGNATIVYTGPLSIANGEMEITFSTEYTYSGGNLLIGFYNTVIGTYVSCSWYGETVNGASVQGYSYSDLASVSPSQRNFIPKTTFTYTPSGTNCFSPNNPTISDISAYEATLSWTPREGQTAWEVCCVSGVFDPDQASWTPVTDTFYTFTNLNAATNYTAYVRTNCAPEVSNPRQVSFTTLATCPNVPTGLSVSNITATTVDVSWTAGTDDSAWEVVVVPSNATPESGIPEPTTDNPYTVTDLQDNTQYKVYVRTDCGGGDHSYWSTAATFTTKPHCTPPVNVAISQITGTSALVTWEPAIFGATNYTVEYSLTSEENWTMELVDGTQYMISGLEPDSNYSVMVYSNCDLGTADTIERSFTTNCLVGGNIAIGNGSSTDSYLPSYSYYNYSYSQQLYTAAELGGATTFNSISFHISSFSEGRNLLIYMKHTNASSIGDGISAAGAQQVYTHNGVTSMHQGWNTFTLTTPFEYNGTDNLLVVVIDRTGSYSSPYNYWTGHTASGMSCYDYNDDDPYSISSLPDCYSSSFRANVIFGSPCDNDASCVRPNVYVTETSESSITIDWAPGYTESAWNVEYSVNDTDWVSLGSVNAHPYEVGGLDPDTRYKIRVSSNCGSEESDYAMVSARTECSSIEVSYTEDFDDAPASGSGNMVTCWTRNTNNSTAYPYTSNSQHHSGNYSVYFYGTSSYYSYLASPRIDDMVAMDNLQVRFWARKSTATYYIQVGIMTDPNDYSTFQQIGQNLTPDTINTWQLLQVNTDSYTGDGRYIAFRIPADITNNMYIDDVNIDNIPMCEHVSDIHTTTIASDAADIAWTEGGSESAWEVVYGISGTITNPDNETSTTVQSPEISLSDLNSNTVYDVFVKAVCSGSESSIWMPYTFRTECGVITTIPFSENFESYSTGSSSPIYCWTRYNTYSTSYDYPYVSNSYAFSGSKSLYFYHDGSSYAMIATPAFDQAIDFSNLQVSFMMRSSSASSAKMIVGMMDNPTDPTTFDPIDTITVSASDTWEPVETSLSSYTGSASHIALKSLMSGYYSIYVDNFVVEEIPSCPKPTHVTATSSTTDTVVLSWTDANVTQWDIIYGLAGFNPDSISDDIVIIEGVTENPYTITELEGGNVYDFYVRSICDGGDMSPWCAVPASAIPFLMQMGITGSATVTSCGLTVTDNGGLNGDYALDCDYTLTILPSEPNSTLVISGTLNTENNYDKLHIYSGTTTNAANLIETLTGSVSNFGPFVSEDGAITLHFESDYMIVSSGFVATINCIEAADCPRPSNFAISELTSNSVSLSWQGSDNASAWNVAYGPSPFIINEETPYEPVYDTTITIDELTAGQEYDFYVQTDCGDGVSEWRGPITAAPGVFTFGTTGSSSITACGLTVYDNGGPSGNYSSNCDYTLTVYPSDPDSVVSVSGTFAGESTWDYLEIYDGTTTNDVLLEQIMSGTGSSGTVVNFGPITSETGPLTLRFYSDGSSQYAGFAATISCVEAPDCRTPYGLTANNIAADEATITWTADEDATLELYYKENSDTTWTVVTTSEFTDVNTYLMTNLTPATTYNVYVANICTDDTLTSATITFTTLCAAVTAPYSENFAGFNTAVSPCWERFTGLASSVFNGGALTASTSGWYFNSSNVFPLGHPNINIYGLYVNYWLVSPSIDLSQLSEPTLMFSLALTDYGNTNPIEDPTAQADDQFMVIISTDNGATWSAANATVWNNTTSGDYVYNTISTTGEDIAISLSQYAGQTIRIAFYGESTESGGDNDLHIANVMVDEAPTCPRPSQVTATATTTSSVTLSWTPGGDETSWNVEYGPAGFNPGEGTTMTGVTNPVTISSLSGSTTYDFYVQANCNGGETSLWSYVYSATTDCDIVTLLPYTENFDNISSGNANAFPTCWARPVQYSGFPYAVTTPHSTPASLKFQSLTTVPATAVTPQFAEDAHNLSLNFWLKAESITYSGTFEVGVMTDPNDTATFVGVWTIQPTSTDWTEYTLNFDTTAVSGANKYIAFRQHSNSSSWYYWLDDVTIDLNGTPTPPTDPTVTTNDATSIGQTSATLNASITNPSGVTITAKGFEWRQTIGGSYTTIAGTGTGNDFTANLTGLTANTSYTYKAFITFNGTTVTGDEMTFTTLDEGQQTCNVPTNLTATATAYNTANVTWTAGGSETSWNLQYRTGTANWTTLPVNTTTYQITGLAAQTTYEVRVQANCGDNNTSDWTATVSFTTPAEPVEPCDAPTNLQVNSITQTSATMTWTAGGSETSWKVGYKLSTASQWQEATVQTTSYDIEGLTANSTYDVRVKAVCAADNESDFITSSFTTTGVGIDNITLANSINLMPNPADNYIELSINSNVEVKEAVIFNAFGQMIQTVQLTENHARIDLSDMAAGMYFVRVNGEGMTATKKFIKR